MADRETALQRFERLLVATNGDAGAALQRFVRGGSVRNRIGQSGSTGTTRRYRCNGCGAQLGTESARYRPTVRETSRNAAHEASCEEWARWDSAASMLAGADGDVLAVALDAAIEAVEEVRS